MCDHGWPVGYQPHYGRLFTGKLGLITTWYSHGGLLPRQLASLRVFPEAQVDTAKHFPPLKSLSTHPIEQTMSTTCRNSRGGDIMAWTQHTCTVKRSWWWLTVAILRFYPHPCHSSSDNNMNRTTWSSGENMEPTGREPWTVFIPEWPTWHLTSDPQFFTCIWKPYGSCLILTKRKLLFFARFNDVVSFLQKQIQGEPCCYCFSHILFYLSALFQAQVVILGENG